MDTHVIYRCDATISKQYAYRGDAEIQHRLELKSLVGLIVDRDVCRRRYQLSVSTNAVKIIHIDRDSGASISLDCRTGRYTYIRIASIF
jgi:hypothetical protein